MPATSALPATPMYGAPVRSAKYAGRTVTLRAASIAAVLLAVVSGAIGWRLASSGSQERGLTNPPVASMSAEGSSLGVSAIVPAASVVASRYGREIVELERALALHRRAGLLDAATVQVIERNLGVIDAAIAECLTALGVEPGSEFLTEALEDAYRAKVGLLRLAETMATQ
jgi:hypothetical protein